MKFKDFFENHPIISNLIPNIFRYPCYFVLYAAYIHLMPVYHSMIRSYDCLSVSSVWASRCAMFALIPWIINTVLNIIATRNPFNKFGSFMNRFEMTINTIVIYSLIFLIDYAYGEILISSHMAMCTVIAAAHSARLISLIRTHRKIQREFSALVH